MPTTLRIAVVQIDIAFADPDRNIDAVLSRGREAAEQGARLVVFPECTLTGYCFESRDEAWSHALCLDDPRLRAVEGLCREAGVWIIVGFAERADQKLHNTCVLLGPAGLVAVYRKTHLPSLGLDKYADQADGPYAVNQVEGVNVALGICYDASFPEFARVLTLRGADLIALPTNWPPGAEPVPEHVIPTRALENNIYFAAANRVGQERGFRFIGNSVICAPDGSVLAAAGPDEETILFAEVDPTRARQKRIIRVPGKHEIDRLSDRRTDLYGDLVR